MRTLTIITTAGVVFAAATFGLRKRKAPLRVPGPRWKRQSVSGVLYQLRVKRPVPPRSATSCRNQKALSVPRPELTRE
jgi:hypothetical protein